MTNTITLFSVFLWNTGSLKIFHVFCDVDSQNTEEDETNQGDEGGIGDEEDEPDEGG